MDGIYGEAAREENKDFILEVLKKLISIPTEVPPGREYKRAIEVVAKFCSELGLVTEVIEVPQDEVDKMGLVGERVNLVAWHGASDIALNSHVDVVPAGRGWTVDPFGGVVRDGEVYGRGAADNKGGVAAILLAVKLINDGMRKRAPLTLAITVDEEIGGELGLGYLLRTGRLRAKHFMIADGYSESIVFCHNGIYRFKVVVKGKAAHASVPFKGSNAIVKAARLIQELDRYAAGLLQRRSKYPSSPDLIKQGLPNLFPTLNIGVISGGVKVNVVPDECIMEVERRFIPEEALEDVKSEVEALIRAYSEERRDVLIQDVSVRWPAVSDPNSEVALATREACREVYGREITLAGITGATDASHVSRYLGVPFVIHGPIGEGSNIHAPDEKVRVDDILNVAKVFALAAARLLGYR